MSDNPAESVSGAPQHVHGYKLADEEMERLERKRASDDVLDPIALDDPQGLAVERVIARVGAVVVLILIAGILIAQVACKNIQLWGIPSFAEGVTQQAVEKALDSGVTWAGGVARFADPVAVEYDESVGTVAVTVESSSPRSREQLVNVACDQALAFSMNLFLDPSISQVSYTVVGTNVHDVSKAADPSDEETEVSVVVVWQRDAQTGAVSSRIEGFDPTGAASEDPESE